MDLADLISAGSAPAESYADLQEQRRQYADDLKENTGRPATVCVRYISQGIGQIAPPDPVLFQMTFTEEPWVTSGMFVHQLPDASHWLYPQVTAGVRQWVTQDNPADYSKAAEDPTRKPFYVGAYLVFVVETTARKPPQTDGSDYSYLTALRDQLTLEIQNLQSNAAGQLVLNQKLYEYQVCLKHLADAVEAKYLQANPPRVVITHNLVFQQYAIKPLPDNIVASLDTELPPINVAYTRSLLE